MLYASLVETSHRALATPDIIIIDRKSTRLNSSHSQISYAVFCLKKKNTLLHCMRGLLCLAFSLPLSDFLQLRTLISRSSTVCVLLDVASLLRPSYIWTRRAVTAP